ncbi:Hydra magnipapillata [Seminavis robusta]|uniref:Hydra magnipapillata n=1 Tax=Seminavis robusta TaxID=568900 RepID=A0A9N8E7E2_9STRA|nr:Hydra magnipapillata [Seminavis robusta]|eukprot:Sro700_g189630.1 Hydra magnipapillata (1226) ;mRNA; r:24514-28364
MPSTTWFTTTRGHNDSEKPSWVKSIAQTILVVLGVLALAVTACLAMLALLAYLSLQYPQVFFTGLAVWVSFWWWLEKPKQERVFQLVRENQRGILVILACFCSLWNPMLVILGGALIIIPVVILTNTKEGSDHTNEPDELKLDNKALSVHYLSTQFLQEVQEAGLNRDATIYQIEDLRQEDQPGVIRRKGIHVMCPIDQKMGAAYVHCVGDDPDNVGLATRMLSYTWNYAIGDIVDTLVEYCETTDQDPKRTYVWICCLCVNQHRVIEQSKQERSGIFKTRENKKEVDFFAEFGCRVTGIGHMLAMMAPWNDPYYLTRIWCIYEFSTAHQKKARQERCKVTILMPPREKEALVQAVLDVDGDGVDGLNQVLAKTRIENAKASVESDRETILRLVRWRRGGFAKLNQRVNELLREWVRQVLNDLIEDIAASTLENGENNADGHDVVTDEDKENQAPTEDPWKENQLALSVAHFQIGLFLMRLGEVDGALAAFEKNLSIHQAVLGENHPDTGVVYVNIGMALQEKGDHENALVACRKSLALRETSAAHDCIGHILMQQEDYDGALLEFERSIELSKEEQNDGLDPDMSKSYNNLGLALHQKGELDGAFEAFSKALEMAESTLGDNDPTIAAYYVNLGSLCEARGEVDNAMQWFNKALAIEELVLGEDHPSTATTYIRVADLLAEKGDTDGAFERWEMALRVQETAFGLNYHGNADTCLKLGRALVANQDYEEALKRFRRSLEIEQSVRGDDHPRLAVTHDEIAGVLMLQEKHSAAMEEYRSALAIRQVALDPVSSDLGISHTNIGVALQLLGDHDAALSEFRKGIVIHEKTLGKDNATTAVAYRLLGTSLFCNGEYNNARIQYERALASYVSVFGEEHEETATSHHLLAAAMQSQDVIDLDGALRHNRKALAIRTALHGEEHSDSQTSRSSVEVLSRVVECMESAEYGNDNAATAEALTAFAFDSQENNEPGAALIALKKVLGIYLSEFGEHHANTAGAYDLIGHHLFHVRNDCVAAMSAFRKSLAIRESVLGLEHLETASSHRYIGDVLFAQNDTEAAVAEYESEGRIRVAEHIKALPSPPDNVETARALAEFAAELEEKEEHHIAFIALQKVLAINRKDRGENHADTANAHDLLGHHLYRVRDDYDGALISYRKALAIRELVVGSEHRATARSHHQIGNVLYSQRDYDAAENEYEVERSIREIVGYDDDELEAKQAQEEAMKSLV